MSDIIKTQRSFATHAMHHPAHRFDHLYRTICQQEWIQTALQGMLANKGSRTPGIRGVTKDDLSSADAKHAFVQEIEQELRERRFRPSPVRRVHIPKGQGKYRPLGISTLITVRATLPPLRSTPWLAVVDLEARAADQPRPKSRQTSSAVSDRKTAGRLFQDDVVAFGLE